LSENFNGAQASVKRPDKGRSERSAKKQKVKSQKAKVKNKIEK
jgi:hypothetical protein